MHSEREFIFEPGLFTGGAGATGRSIRPAAYGEERSRGEDALVQEIRTIETEYGG